MRSDMFSDMFSYLPKEDRDIIKKWIALQIEEGSKSYSRFDRFLTFIERCASGAKSAISGTANWIVETISKIGFHIFIANIAYFGLTNGAEWYNGKLMETMSENETLTEHVARVRESNRGLVAERDAALRLVEEKQALLDNANSLVKSKQAELDNLNRHAPPPATQEVNTTSNATGGTTFSYDRDKFYGCIVDNAGGDGQIWLSNATYCTDVAKCSDKTEYKLCWIGLNTGSRGSLDEAMGCWDRACQ